MFVRTRRSERTATRPSPTAAGRNRENQQKNDGLKKFEELRAVGEPAVRDASPGELFQIQKVLSFGDAGSSGTITSLNSLLDVA